MFKKYLILTLFFVLSLGLPSEYKIRHLNPENRFELLKFIDNFHFDKFHSYDEIYKFLEDVNKSIPEYASFEKFGETYENRSLNVFKISNNHQSNVSKNIVLIDAGIHAREWIGPATALSYIEQILMNMKDYDYFFNHFDLYIVPLLNPDGYEYTRTTDRTWRKNRSPQRNGCFGVDLNRNFGYHWGETSTSDDPCSYEIFRGDYPNSESETRSLEKLVNLNMDKIKAYVTLHSFAGLILYPYGYNYNVTTPDHEAMVALADKMVKAVESETGSKYRAENSAGLYPADGPSDDYVKSLGVKYVYTVEIKGRNFAEYEKNIDIRSREIRAVLDTVLKQVAEEAEN